MFFGQRYIAMHTNITHFMPAVCQVHAGLAGMEASAAHIHPVPINLEVYMWPSNIDPVFLLKVSSAYICMHKSTCLLH